MHFEVSVALNFLIAYLYNKLPRRRVNMLGEQMLEHLRIKFQGHWYPERPTKGSAYRSIRISKEKVDKVLVNAAIDVGLDLQEILDTLPNDLTIWIDPGEVSYRIGEKGPVKILYEDERRLLRKNTNKDSLNSESSSDSEEREGPSRHDVDLSIRPFNPDAQIFRPIPDNVDTISLLSNSINSLISLSPTSPNLNSSSGSSSSGLGNSANLSSWTTPAEHSLLPTISSPTVGTTPASSSPSNSQFLNKTLSTPVFSPQSFAQTKFGSLKSKHVGRRNQSKMLPSEFSAYIKQKEQIQQSRVLPIPFIENNVAPISSTIVRPTHYRNQFNPFLANPAAMNSTMFHDAPLRPTTLPLSNSQAASLFLDQKMATSSST